MVSMGSIESIGAEMQLAYPLVSVIIPTKNCQSTLVICLESIRRQTYDNIEIIVVDSSSTDNTRSIAIRYGATVISSDYKMAAARNYGAKFAKGEYLFHMDSDMKLTKRVVEKCVQAAQNGAHAVVVPQIFEGEGYLGKCRALEFYSTVDDNMLKSSRFMTRYAFESVGGYDGKLDAGEDWDITQKIEARYKITRIDQYLVHGWGKYDLVKNMKKKYNYGKTVKLYMKKYPEHARHQWSPLRIKHFNYQVIKRDGLHAVGLLFMKMCEFTAGWLGMVMNC